MRAVGRSWTLVLLAAITAGCLPTETGGLPASFVEELRDSGWIFTATSPGPEVMPAAAIVEELRGRTIYGSFLASRAVPIFGELACGDTQVGCRMPGAAWGKPGMVWLVVYPDSAVAGGDVGWALVDGMDGFAIDRHFVHRPGLQP